MKDYSVLLKNFEDRTCKEVDAINDKLSNLEKDIVNISKLMEQLKLMCNSLDGQE